MRTSLSRSGGPSFLACVLGVSACVWAFLVVFAVCVWLCVLVLVSALRWLTGRGFSLFGLRGFSWSVYLARHMGGVQGTDLPWTSEGQISLGQGWRVWIGSTSLRVPGVVRGSADALEMPSVTLWQFRRQRLRCDGRRCRCGLGRSPGELNGVAYSLPSMPHSEAQFNATVASILAHVLHCQHGSLSTRTTTSFLTTFGVLRGIARSSQEDFLCPDSTATMQFYYPQGWRRQLFLSCSVDL